MTNEELLARIVTHPKIMSGKPVIRGTRLTVESILNLLAHGTTKEEIIRDYYGVTPDDIEACVLFKTRPAVK
jgi:uncharacterized protein (DUF433 family)